MKRIYYVLAAVLMAVSAPADPVAEIDYQGKVLVGDEAFTGPGYFKLALSDVDSTANLWSSDSTLSGEPAGVLTSEVYSGVFSLAIGDTDVMDALDPDIFSAGEDLYLRVWFSTNAAAGFEEMLPSQKLLSAPYAINAARVGGYDVAGIRAGLATGTPLYVESPETDPVWSAASNLYYLQSEADALFATGTPVYVEQDTVYADDLANGVIATGTPVYVETDPVYRSQTNLIVFKNDPAGGDLTGVYPNPTVDQLQGRAVSSAAPSAGNILQWNGSAWAPASGAAAGAEADPVYTNETRTGMGFSDFKRSGGYLQIDRLQGVQVLAGGPNPGDSLVFTGIRWETTKPVGTDPNFTAVSNSIVYDGDAAGGDLAGTYPNPTVDGLLGRPLSTNPPSPNDLLIWDGTNWNATGLSGSAGYGKVNTMSAVLPGDPINVLGAGRVTVTDIPGPTNAVQISVPVPELQNVIWVATNGTPDGPGNIDSPYDTVGKGYAIAASRYAGQPATLIISSGTYMGITNILNMTTGNVHVIGLNRPFVDRLTVRAPADPSLRGKQRVENLVFGTPSIVFNTASDVKIKNCRFNGIVSVQGPNAEFQDCIITNNMQISASAKNLAVYNSSIRGSHPTTPTVDITANGASNIQFIACEIVNTIGALAIRGASTATAIPPWHFSHNVISGNVEARSAATFMLNHNIIQGALLPNTGGAMTQYFANNVIIGTNNWIQAEPATMDAHGNTVYSNAVLTIPSPWND